MRIVMTKKYYLDSNDRKRLKAFMYKNNYTHIGIADKLDLSVSMFEFLLNGERALTTSVIYKLKELGFSFRGYRYKKGE